MSKKTGDDRVFLAAVGDVCPNVDVVTGGDSNPETLFAHTASFTKEADIAFCQLETTFSERRSLDMQRVVPGLCAHPKNVAAMTYAGFNVVSFASNLALSCGEDAFNDTLDVLKRHNMEVIGVGKNIAEARKPAIIERKGTRIAILAYRSVLPRGFQAEANKSGAAPLRASTFYEQVDWQAGTPPRIITIPNAGDVQAMREDIAKVRPNVDIVIVSVHWGVHYMPSIIAMYQKEAAHAAIDAGADLVLGHHAHILKGVEVYKGKVIFYSIGNFGIQEGHASEWLKADQGRLEMRTLWGWKEVDLDYPNYPFPADSRKTILVRCVFSGKRIQKISFLPVMINKKSQPEVMPRQDKRSDEVVKYLEWASRDQGFDTKFSRDGDDVTIVF